MSTGKMNMWMRWRQHRPQMLCFLPEAINGKKKPEHQAVQRLRHEVSALLPLLVPDDATAMKQPGLSNYPWCFVMPARAADPQTYITGAVIPAAAGHLPAAVCVVLQQKDMVQRLAGEINLPFWMMRFLALSTRNPGPQAAYQHLDADCHALLTMSRTSVWRHKRQITARQTEICSRLSEMTCEADFSLEGKTGVEFMPWRNWPECVSESHYIWFWRQNRHGKIIESQRKLITYPVT